MKKPLLAAAEYRHRAAGARARAQMMPTENAKLLMMRIAEDYERMALDREKFAQFAEDRPSAPAKDQAEVTTQAQATAP